MSPRPAATTPRALVGPPVAVTGTGPHVVLTVGDRSRRLTPGLARDLADQLHDYADQGVATGRALRTAQPRLRVRRITKELVRLDLGGFCLDVTAAHAIQYADAIVDAVEEVPK